MKCLRKTESLSNAVTVHRTRTKKLRLSSFGIYRPGGSPSNSRAVLNRICLNTSVVESDYVLRLNPSLYSIPLFSRMTISVNSLTKQ
jgi:hypothetical protein